MKCLLDHATCSGLWLSVILGFMACQLEPVNSNEPFDSEPDHSIEISLSAASLAGYDTVNVQVLQDHSRHSPHTYEAIPLMPLLRDQIRAHGLDSTMTTVFFTCKDGYIPSNSFADLAANGRAFLAFRDSDLPHGQYWPDSISEAYAPYYLVWEDIPYGENHLAWPFGLVSINLTESSDPYAELFPADQPEMEPAFLLYKENCLKCHALNQLGGTMGPEFNEPRNITVYWTRENIIAFAQNPQSFRSNSKMPPVKGPTDHEFQLIVDYLEYMADKPPHPYPDSHEPAP